MKAPSVAVAVLGCLLGALLPLGVEPGIDGLLWGILGGSVAGAALALALLHSGWSDKTQESPRSWGWGRKLSMVSQLVGVGSGIVIATGPWTGAFALWFAQAERLGWETRATNTEGLFVAIGLVVALQFVMLSAYVWRADARHKPWRWVALSLMGWFVVDSAWSLHVGGAFNVGMVNIPTLLAQLPWLAWWAAQEG